MQSTSPQGAEGPDSPQSGPSAVLIRALHPYGYRYGHPHPWGMIEDVVWKNDRACFVVYFPQGHVVDYWPVYDPSDPYEFRPATNG